MKERFRNMTEHSVEIEELYRSLGLEDPKKGLTTGFVEKRLSEDGDNSLTERVGLP